MAFRRVLTRRQEQIVRRALAAGATDGEAGEAAGISDRRLYEARLHELADLPRNKRGPRQDRTYAPAPELDDISVEEIYRRAAKIREGWTDEEAAARWCPGFSGNPSP